MISYAPAESLVDKQGMIAREFTLWDTPSPRERQNLLCLVSSRLSTGPTIVIINAFPEFRRP